MTEAYDRCHPAEKLALCHYCYRYIHKGDAVDYVDQCKHRKYNKFYHWRTIAYAKHPVST